MTIISNEISLEALKRMAAIPFGDMVKGVVDVERESLALDAELHSDLEAFLLENGSEQKNLWGINLYPDLQGEGFIEFDSMINLRPSGGNRSRGVDDQNVRDRIVEVVTKRVKR